MVVAIDEVCPDDARDGFPEESRDIGGRELAGVELGDVLFRPEQSGRLLAEGAIGSGVIDPEYSVDLDEEVVIPEDERMGRGGHGDYLIPMKFAAKGPTVSVGLDPPALKTFL